MGSLGQKIRTLRENREWSQTDLAKRLYLSPDAVYKWEKDINIPKLPEIQKMCELFDISIDELTDDEMDVTSYILVDERPASWAKPNYEDSTPHKVYDADLMRGAYLHRFLNQGGAPYSAIYIGNHEQLSCERDREPFMIREWNENGYKRDPIL